MHDEQTGAPWWRDSFDVAHTSLTDVSEHLRLTLASLERKLGEPEFLTRLHNYRRLRSEYRSTYESAGIAVDEEEIPERVEEVPEYQQAVADAEYVAAQRDLGFPVLMSQATIHVWSIMDHWIQDLLTRWLLECPDAIADDVAGKIKLSYDVVIRYNQVERCEYVADLLKDLVGARRRPGVGRFEAILEIMGKDGGVPRETRDGIYELSHVRNIYVHRAGIADVRFVNSGARTDVELGQRVVLSFEDFVRYLTSALQYHLLVFHRFEGSTQTDTSDSPDEDGGDAPLNDACV